MKIFSHWSWWSNFSSIIWKHLGNNQIFWATIKTILVVGSMGIVDWTTKVSWVIPKFFSKHTKKILIINYGDQNFSITQFSDKKLKIQLPIMWQLIPFLVATHYGGSLGVMKSFCVLILTDARNTLGWTPTWCLMQNGCVMLVFSTLFSMQISNKIMDIKTA